MKVFRKTLAGILAVLMMSSAVSATVYANDNLRVDEPGVSVARLGGSDRYETACLIADNGWTSAETVFLANANSYADALAGTPLAHAYSAPILLTDGKKLSDPVKAEIKKLGAKKVYLLGGEAAISGAVEQELGKTYTVNRIWGKTRYGTAVKIAEALESVGQAPADIFVASGVNYPDALSASSPAAIKHAPILYAPADGKLDKETLDYISKSKPYNTYILGGTGAIASAAETALKGTSGSVTRLGGSDRYETSAVIAGQFDPQFKSDHAAFATGRNFPDALAGSVLAAKESMPVLLTAPAKTNGSVKKYFASRSRDKVFVFGGAAVVHDSVVSEYISSVVSDADLDKYVGSYACDRCSIEVKKTGGKNELVFNIWWSSSAFEHEEWSMTGVIDEKTGKVSYSNAKRTNHVFFDSIGKDNVKTVYTDGTGGFTFNSDGSLTWDTDDKDISAKDMKFVSVPGEVKEGAAVEDGKLVIRIAAGDNDLGWAADETVSGSVLKFDGSEVRDGFFTARYSAAGNGKTAVNICHYYTSCASNEMRTWDIEVKNGSISGISDVKTKKNPADSELDSGIIGFWKEDKTEYTNAVTAKNPSRGWDVDITAPTDHGSFLFSATVYYDCSKSAFVYDKGKFFNQTDKGTDNAGEAIIAGSTGSFSVTADGKLVWHNEDERAKKLVPGDITYVRIPVVINHDDDVKAAVYQLYNSNYSGVIEEIKYNSIKVYTKEEIAADEALKDQKIGDRDVVFDINYDLRIVDGYKDIMQFTAGSGEVKGNWVVDKSNVGILRYVSEGEYKVDSFGTGF